MTDDDFEQFAQSQAGPLARLAYQLTAHRESARDLVQDTLLEVVRQWPRVSAARSREAYVRRMLLNTHLNNARRRRLVEVATDLSTALERSTEVPGPDGCDSHEAMWQALASLTRRQRAVLVLRYYEGLDDPAIADLLGCRRATVRSLAARGLTSLRHHPLVNGASVDEAQRGT